MARSPKFDDDEILDRAMSVLWHRGWARTSIRDLEEALEIKAPSIYRRFGSKEGLAAVLGAGDALSGIDRHRVVVRGREG